MVNPRLLQQLAHHSRRRYRRGRPVVFQGEVPANGYVIAGGTVRAYVISDGGDERTIGYYSSGDLVPAGWLFGITNVSLYYYEAFTDCELMALGRDEFSQLQANNPVVMQELTQRLATLYVGSTLQVHALEHSRAQEKLAGILHYLVLLHGTRLSGDRYQIALRLTHQDVAGMVGLSRETASIELARLRKKQVINYARFTYEVDLRRLLALMGSEEFTTMRLKAP